MVPNFLLRNKRVIIYGFSLASLLFLMKWLEWQFVIVDHALELYIGAIAIVFTGLGMWVALKLTGQKKRTHITEKEIYKPALAPFVINEEELAKLGLSKRELEVLVLMSRGLSNRQIAESLFVSVNTIKTHSLRLFEKLEAERRTQAVDKAKKLGIIP
ncbi:response regulator transcription factor [Arcticibacter tournemirensis]|uniref:Response regulator transcription factor n=2 Tax=Arcticibacter tournemirensis TaxID=699437 RepID=A0A4Q0MFE6_9SPHI|nr:response regulator transcription factor [Arcticibacter tournemirensis]